jgi:hypothetical protein
VLYFVKHMVPTFRTRRARSVLAGLGALASVTFVVAACGSNGGSSFSDDPDAQGPSLGDGSFGPPTAAPDSGDPYANDPPPQYCVLDAGEATPPPVGGTPECPDDKNKPGCGCHTLGETAACWTGLRVNRHNGVCKDGTTTCTKQNELSNVWGPCDGEVLPASGATKGKEACKCFSLGSWKIANLSPCFMTFNGDTANPYPVSTVTDGSGANSAPAGQADCPKAGTSAPPAKPTSDWSTDTLTVDCAGHFKVCYQLKAGDFKNPLPTDCAIMDKICVEADYPTENVEQTFPPLPGWTSTSANTACAAKWQASGGYGEMTVQGESILCDKVDDGAGGSVVFNRVQYCPAKCENGQNPTDPECASCTQDGSGVFQ